jgi:hypothetical protein
MMKISRWIILTAPIGVFLIALSKIMEKILITTLGIYFITVLGEMILLPIKYVILPIRFTINMGHAMATGEPLIL